MRRNSEENTQERVTRHSGTRMSADPDVSRDRRSNDRYFDERDRRADDSYYDERDRREDGRRYDERDRYYDERDRRRDDRSYGERDRRADDRYYDERERRERDRYYDERDRRAEDRRYDERDRRREDRRPEERDRRPEERDRRPEEERDDRRRDERERRTVKKPNRGGAAPHGGNPERTVHQIFPYVLFCLSIFAAVSFFLRDIIGVDGGTGAFGSFLADFLCGLFGAIAYAVPLFAFVLALRWRTYVKKGMLLKKLILSNSFMFLLSGIVHVFLEESATRGQIDTTASVLYNNGVARVGGGFFGGFVGEWLGFILRLPGTIILAIPLLIIIGIYLVGMTPSGLWERFACRFRSVQKRREQQRAELYDGEEESAAKKAKIAGTGTTHVVPADPKAEQGPIAVTEWVEPRPLSYTFREEDDEPIRLNGEPKNPVVGEEEELPTVQEQPPAAQSTATPAAPPSPVQILQQTMQEEQVAPAVPAAPAVPVTAAPAAPVRPASPVTPAAPVRPAAPTTPVAPVSPAAPTAQETPSTSETAEQSGHVYAPFALPSYPFPERKRETPATQTVPTVPFTSAASTPATAATTPATTPVAAKAPTSATAAVPQEEELGMFSPNRRPTEQPQTTPAVNAAPAVPVTPTVPTATVSPAPTATVSPAPTAPVTPSYSATPASAAVPASPATPVSVRAQDDPFPIGAPAPQRPLTSAVTQPVEPERSEDSLSPETEEDFDYTPAPAVKKNDVVFDNEHPAAATFVQPTPPVTPVAVPVQPAPVTAPTPVQQAPVTPIAVSVQPAPAISVAEPVQQTPVAPIAVPVQQAPVETVVERVDPQMTPVTPPAPVAPAQPVRPVAPPVQRVATKTEPVTQTPAEPEPVIVEYKRPPIHLLNEDKNVRNDDFYEEIESVKDTLRQTMCSFNVKIQDEINYSHGPSFTRYELRPVAGTSVRSVTNRIDDISLNLASSVRIEAPIPGKAAIGVEVPNTVREIVHMRTMLESEAFQSSTAPLEVPLGVDVGGEVRMCNLAKMPHLLVAGTTGSGKSVCINSMLVSLLYKTSPEDLRLILIDPKQIEFAPYEDVPHLYMPIVTDMQRAAGALACAVQEMERRFSLIKDVGVRNIESYNEAVKNDPDREHLPYIIIVIDEFADLKMSCNNNDPENFTCRIAQKARAAGIHLIIGTQRPTVNVITGTLKTNIPSRIAFMVKQQIDSRTILDVNGAEALTGYGDMLYMACNSSDKTPVRIQGSFVSDGELERVVSYVRKHNAPVRYNQAFMDQIEIEVAKNAKADRKNEDYAYDDEEEGEDDKFVEAVELAIQMQKVATSLLQRRLGVGYGRAAKIIDRMEELGLVSPADGNKPRKILPAAQGYLEHIAAMDGDGGDEYADDYS